MRPKVSIVIPAYNSEKYIAQCLDSIKDQTLDDFEAIVVDDGSSDDTKSIIKSYEAQDKRFKCVAQANQGPSVARNVGIDKSQGHYIIFLDSDDFFDKQLLEKVVSAAESTSADMVVFDYDLYHDGADKFIENVPFYKNDNPKDAFCADDIPDVVFTRVSSLPFKLLKRSFVVRSKLRFPEELHRNEDFVFINKATILASRIAYVDEVLLHYRVGLHTNSSSTLSRYPYDFYSAAKIVRDFLDGRGELKKYEKSFSNMMAEHFVHAVINLPAGPMQQEVYMKLKSGILQEFGIDKMSRKDFYSAFFYQKIKSIREDDYVVFVCDLARSLKDHNENLFNRLERTESRRISDGAAYQKALDGQELAIEGLRKENEGLRTKYERVDSIRGSGKHFVKTLHRRLKDAIKRTDNLE